MSFEDYTNNHARLYERAVSLISEFIVRDSDGRLSLRAEVEDIDVDPIILLDLRRSLEETNRKIRSGEIDSAVFEGYQDS